VNTDYDSSKVLIDLVELHALAVSVTVSRTIWLTVSVQPLTFSAGHRPWLKNEIRGRKINQVKVRLLDIISKVVM
jgi:hypothetical protein